MSAPFTPGPWAIDYPAIYSMEKGERVGRVASVSISYKDTATYEANARLIAAAPDLFEALDALNDHWNGVGDYDNSPDDEARLQAKVSGALAKARGEQ